MKNFLKRTLATVLSVVMTVCMLPSMIFAINDAEYLTVADLNLQSDVYLHPFSAEGVAIPRADGVIKSYWQSNPDEKFDTAMPCAWEVNGRDASHPNAFVATNSAPCDDSLGTSDPNYNLFTYSYSCMSYQFAGPATVAFDWRCSCEDYGGEYYDPDDSDTYLWDSYVLVVDGTVVMQMGGDTGWLHSSYDVIGEGLHTIAWMYTKDAGYGQYEDTAFIDNITSTARNSYTLDAEAPTLTYVQNGVTTTTIASGSSVPFPFGEVTSCEFFYSPVSGTSYMLTVNGEEIAETSVSLNPYVSNRISLVAVGADGGFATWNASTVVDVSGCTVNDVVSCEIADASWNFTNDTIYPWIFDIMKDGSAYLHSGNSGVDNSESSITLNIIVPEGKTYYLSYQYAYSSEGNYDKFYLPNNDNPFSGKDEVSIIDNVEFTSARIQLEAGPHAISWKYTKDSSSAKGFDGAVIRNLSLSNENNASTAKITVHYDSGVSGVNYSINNGTPVPLIDGQTFEGHELDNITLTATLGVNVCKGFFDADSSARVSTDSTYSFELGKENLNLKVLSSENNDFHAIEGYASPEHLTVESRPNKGWALTADGSLGTGNQLCDNTVCTMTVTPDVNGVLYYEYKTSSEGNYDCLYYSIGTEVTDSNFADIAQNFDIRAEFSGEMERWKEETLPVKAGQTVYFCYRKDGGGQKGSDTAWMKNLRMETNIVKTSLTVSYNSSLADVRYSLNGAESVPLTADYSMEVSDKDVVVLTVTTADGKFFNGFWDENTNLRLSALPTYRLIVGTEPVHLSVKISPNNDFSLIDGYAAAENLTVMSRPVFGWSLDSNGNLVPGNQGQGGSAVNLAIRSSVKGVLYFDYRTSSEAGYDGIYYMSEEINGDNVDSSLNYVEVYNKKDFSGEITEWKTEAISIDVGQTIYIAYRKDGSGDKGADTVWLRNIYVDTQISKKQITLEIDHPELATVVDNYDTVENGQTLTYFSGTKCVLTIALKNRAIFLGWYDANTGKRLSTEEAYRFTVKNDVNIIAKIDSNLYTDVTGATINAGIESIKSRTNYPWLTDEDGNFMSTNTSAAGKDGTVYDVAVKVNKSGLLFFDYKTSSEANYDCLLYQKGIEITENNYDRVPNYGDRANYSGERDWTTVQMVVTEGDTIYFAYRKDSSGAGSSQDKVWLRNFVVSSGNVMISAAANNDAYGSVSGDTGSVSVGSKISLSATPASGYDFYGWTLNGNTVSLDANYSFVASIDAVYEARFAPAGSLEARVGLTFYETIEDAFAAGDTVILAVNLTLNRDLTIPAGKTLLLPYSASDTTGYKEGGLTPRVSFVQNPDGYRYRTLSIPEGKILTVSGSLIVGGVQHYPDQSGQGHTSGSYAQLINNGTLTVNGTLTNYGLITGSGTMKLTPTANAKTVYVVTDYSGGTNTEALYNDKSFPFGQYATVNIQCSMVIQGGAHLDGMTSLYFFSSINQQDIPLVGTSDGLIVLPAGSTLTVTYDAAKRVNATIGNIFLGDYGKTSLTIDGNASAGKFDLSGYGSTGMYLNIPYTYDLVINSGTFTMANLYRVMPGATITVNSGAALSVSGGLQVMDAWAQYDKSGKQYPSADILKENGFSKSGELIVNGTLNIDGTFAGLVQTNGTSGKIITSGTSTLSGSFFGGSSGGYTDNLVNYTLSARAYQGSIKALETGHIYYSQGNGTFTPQDFSLSQHRDGSTKTISLSDQTRKGLFACERTLSFDVGGGDSLDVQKVVAGSTITLPTPTYTGQTFQGWYASPAFEGSAVNIQYTMPDEDTTLYAKWDVAYFDVTTKYQDEDGNTIGAETVQRIEYNKKAAESGATTEISGYKYKQTEGIDNAITQDTTLVAVYESYLKLLNNIIVFDADSLPEARGYYAKLNSTQKESYDVSTMHADFVAAIKAAESAIIVAAVESKISDVNNTLDGIAELSVDKENPSIILVKIIAPATKAKSMLDISFLADLFGYEGIDTIKIEGDKVNKNQMDMMMAVAYAALKEESGCSDLTSFKNWLVSNQETLTIGTLLGTTVNASLVAKETAEGVCAQVDYQVAFWDDAHTPGTVATATISFEVDGGSAVSSITKKCGAIVQAPVDPSKVGYSFAGWFTDEACSEGKEYTFSIMPDSNITLYAKWTVNQYTISFNTQGGSAVDPITQDYNTPVTKPADPSMETNIFKGWYTDAACTDGNEYSFTTMPAENLTLYAKWVHDPYSDEYAITWVINGVSTPEIYHYGDTLNVPNTNIPDDDYGSYTFTGWDVNPTGLTVSGIATYTANYDKAYEVSIGDTTYRTLAIGLAKAQNGDTVRLDVDITLDADITVPAGVTLLVPCMDNDLGYQPKDDGNGGTIMFNADGTSIDGKTGVGPNAAVYRTLTVPAGKTLTINGSVMVNAVTGRPGAGHYDQDVTGGYGQIVVNGDIVVNGTLENFGYIKGSGTVTANSGSTVGDLYIARNWRGGTQASQIVPYVYPMNEYDLHNIETKLLVKSGASYTALVKMYANNQYYYTRFPQVNSANGLIRLESGAKLVKTYKEGREVYAIDGGAQFACSTLKITGLDLSTGMDYFVYPIDGDIDFELAGGNYKFVNNYKFMPGASITVGDGSSVEIDTGKILVLYNKFEDVTNTDNTEYPSNRTAASITLVSSASIINNGSFAGTVDGKRANVKLGANNVPGITYYYSDHGQPNTPWSVRTYEANGYNNKCKTLTFECIYTEPETVVVNPDPGPTGGGSIGGGSARGGSTADITPAENSENGKAVALELEASKIENGVATVSVKNKDMNEALQMAEEEKAESIVINVAVSEKVSVVTVKIPSKLVKTIADSTSLALEINTGNGNVVLPGAALDAIVKQANGTNLELKVEAGKSSLKNETVAVVTINSGKNKITSFGGKSITILVPVDTKVYKDGKFYQASVVSEDGTRESTFVKIVGGKAVAKTTHLSSIVITDNPVSVFKDVLPGEWYEEPAIFGKYKGLFIGDGLGNFLPEYKMNEAELCTVLYRIAKSENPPSGEDPWYAPVQLWAEEQGLIKNFKAESYITRAEFITMFYKTLKLAGGYDTKVTDAMRNELKKATDYSSIAFEDIDAIAWSVNAGLIKGVSEEKLEILPDSSIRRAEVATMLMRYYQGL